MIKFKVGSVYRGCSPCDQNCIIVMTVLKRTAKTITVQCSQRPTPRVMKPYVYNDVEAVKPWGSYSLCPTITAESESL